MTTNNPPPYENYENFSQQPPQGVYPNQNYNPAHPPIFTGQQIYHTQPVPNVTVVTQQPCKDLLINTLKEFY